MPIYSVKNAKTKEEYDVNMSYDDFVLYLEENKNLARVYKPIMIVDPVGIGITKPPVDFQKHVLGKIKDKTKGGAIANKRWNIPKEI